MKTIKLLLLGIVILALSCSKDDDATPPVNKAPEIKAQSFTVSESATDTDVFGTVKATDPDKDALSYSITANSDNLFEITKAGALSLVAGKTLDFETKTSYEITVEVTDGKAKASAKITITVTDVNENQSPVIDDQTFTVAEDVTNSVIDVVTATDPEGDTLTYRIKDNDDNLFEIAGDGILSLAPNKVLDYESRTNYAITITVSDGNGGESSARIYIKITDVLETGDEAFRVRTLAGNGTHGFTNGTGTSAQFSTPIGVDIDSNGNIYVADRNNNVIRKITPAGVVSTFAGSTFGYADGTGTAAKFNSPYGIAIDANDNIYVGDYINHRIRKITPAGVVTTLAGSGVAGSADGTGTAAQFNEPYGLDVDSNGNVYVADYGNNRIRKITPAGVVTTFAGSSRGFADGTGTAAMFKAPHDVAVDNNDNVYVTDGFNHRIRKITPAGVVTTFAGTNQGFADGTGTQARFNTPEGITIDNSGNLYVTDRSNHCIRKITSTGVVSILAGSNDFGFVNGTGATARFRQPAGITVNASGVFYVTDESNHSVRKIEPFSNN
ncbi:streptogramin lyase [Aquimarina sp. EL_43]|uniref:cadherin domain-containing protein n=1 Tax=unclassified Aquimarina TaxID=2627091 RepID=UPI0018CAEA12|nr:MULTISPECIES: cadherin domain-containing protein [unclassified Aquimarina]MBG6129077.1 streptogramin lyase [Aquimarina sp. EL_35]MBG6150142.1 streptogramin lyase [Aquimarina sp. EL_32]MBG6167173.1 streptogramin lyase [Aquimarina sp. EL_43]